MILTLLVYYFVRVAPPIVLPGRLGAAAAALGRVAIMLGRLASVLGRLASVGGRWSAKRRERRDAKLFATLDAHALRDLGLARSEIASYGAEADGDVPPTRRRLAVAP